VTWGFVPADHGSDLIALLWLVWGRGGRMLWVVFLIDEDDSVYVIHARPLTEREKRRHRKERQE